MTNAELAILGLVVEEPRHGYEIERVIEARGMRNWTEIGFSSIYYLLKRLAAAGLIEYRVDRGDAKGPSRKVYGATRKGLSEWKRATRRALATPQRQYPDIFLGMAGMPGLETRQVVEALSQYLERLKDRRIEIDEARMRSGGPNLPHHVEAMFTYSEAMIEAEQEWIRGFIEEMSTRKEPV